MKDGVESKMYAKKRLYLTSLYGHLRLNWISIVMCGNTAGNISIMEMHFAFTDRL